MKLRGAIFGGLAISLLFTACVHKSAPPAPPVIPPPAPAPVVAPAPAPAAAVATKPIFVPDYSHASQPLPDGILAWDGASKTVDVNSDADSANFEFNFTNISPNEVVILSTHPSCHCTVAKMPATPWEIPAGTSGTLKASVDLNIAGHMGTLFKRVTVVTDKGSKELLLRVNIHPVAMRPLSDSERQMGMAKAKMDRQAVFHNDCASCHAKNVNGLYGQALYDSVCGICHDSDHRATIVPDLGHLKVPTNQDFWRTWIAYGKPGSLMPAFSSAQGGPLTDMQVASLAAYLNSIHPSHVPSPQ